MRRRKSNARFRVFSLGGSHMASGLQMTYVQLGMDVLSKPLQREEATCNSASRRVAILHYAGPPGIGGVESTIFHQATRLSRRGFEVEIVAGSGSLRGECIHTTILSNMASSAGDVLAMKHELDLGYIPPGFDALAEGLQKQLEIVLMHADAIIIHNICTLHKNLALTQALYALATGKLKDKKWIGWHHDPAWTAEQYARELHDGMPWSLLRAPWPGMTHVTVSEERRRQLAQLFYIDEEAIHFIPPGIDAGRLLSLTPAIESLEERLAAADALLLLPARITRRKNIAFALQALSEARRKTGLDLHLLVTGPPGPHNPSNQRYLDELLELRRQLQLDQSAHFLALQLSAPLSDDDIGALYRLCDLVFLPSLEEGFGMPVLEATAAGKPMVCSNLAPMIASGGDAALYFDPRQPPAAAAQLIAGCIKGDLLLARRRSVLRECGWHRIIDEQLIPLL
jgi:glycosyltransferase involved in cell wall biosynthesis